MLQLRQQILYFFVKNLVNEVKNRVFEVKNPVSEVTNHVIEVKYPVIEVIDLRVMVIVMVNIFDLKP